MTKNPGPAGYADRPRDDSPRPDPPSADRPRVDPRRERSRSRLLDAATALLTSGGVEAVTIDAVTRASKVARTTLYRHFDGSAAVITAAFERLLPPITEPPQDGTVRDLLIALLDKIAESIDAAPLHLTVFGWLALGSGRQPAYDAEGKTVPDDDTASLRQRVIAQYRVPFDALLERPDVRAQIGDYDNTLAMLQLTGPLVFARLAGLPPLDRDQRARIVDAFLAGRAAEHSLAGRAAEHTTNREAVNGMDQMDQPYGGIRIRAEAPGDAVAIRTLTSAAFAGAEHSSGTEAAIVDALRADGALTISLVACTGPDGDAAAEPGPGDEVVGHIAFSPVTVDGRDEGWYGLGPVSTMPAWQRRGVGSALVRRGLELIEGLGARGCVLLGDPEFYGRFGFRADPALRYAGAPAEYFQALVISGGMPTGTVEYHEAFGAE